MAVARGEFEHRVDNAGVHGELELFGNQVNDAVSSLQRTSDGLSSVMRAIVGGDFTYRMDPQVEGSIRTDVDHAMEAMEAAISEITNVINHGIKEISTGNEELSNRTSSQAASLEETAASMEEMSSTVRHNADNANEANGLSKRANQQAVEGVDVLERSIKAMAEISSSSQKMTEIISLIDSIAFQTNLLALNAALVEETAAASRKLIDQANHLEQLIGFFKVSRG